MVDSVTHIPSCPVLVVRDDHRGVFENIVDVVMALFQILTIFEPQGALALGILSIIFTVLSLAYSIFLALAKRKPDSWQDKLLIKLLKKHPKLIPKIDRSMELPVDWLEPPPSGKEDAEFLAEDDTDVEIDSSLEEEKKPCLFTLLSKCQLPQKEKKVQDFEIDSSLEEEKAADLTIEQDGESLAEVDTDVEIDPGLEEEKKPCLFTLLSKCQLPQKEKKVQDFEIDPGLEEEKASGLISEQSDIPESGNYLDGASGSTPDVQISEAPHNQVQDDFAALEQEITAASSSDQAIAAVVAWVGRGGDLSSQELRGLLKIFAEHTADIPTIVPDPSPASAETEGSMAVADCDITSQPTAPEELLPEEHIPTPTPEGVTIP